MTYIPLGFYGGPSAGAMNDCLSPFYMKQEDILQIKIHLLWKNFKNLDGSLVLMEFIINGNIFKDRLYL